MVDLNKLKTAFLKSRLLRAERRQKIKSELAKKLAKELELQKELKQRLANAKKLNLSPKEKALLKEKIDNRAKTAMAIKKEVKFIASQLGKASVTLSKLAVNSASKPKPMPKNKKKKKAKPKKKMMPQKKTKVKKK